jgi:glutamate synthase (NADPH) small chain
MGWVKPPRPASENGLSAGIIGAGPAGLAAADILRRKGYSVHIYDRYDRVGGLLVYGIPNFKLEKHVVARRQKLLEDAGIVFHLNFEVGKHSTLEELRFRHDAILIATGVYKAREVDIPNNSLSGIFPALDYLITSNKIGLGDKVQDHASGLLNAHGKNVVVIGGGDTAMDCVRTAVRQGAKKVSCLYRRDRANMPGSAREVKNAEAEGVEFIWLSAPKAFVGVRKVEKILAGKMRLTSADASGRQAVLPVENSQFTLPCDMAIKALGFDADDIPTAFGMPDLKLTSAGTLKVDGKQMASMPGVFAAGDIVRGASLVVWAIKDGRDAAFGMDAWVKAHHKAKVA